MAVQLPYARFGEVAPLYEQVPFGGAHAEAALLHPQSRLFVDDATTPSVALVRLRGDDMWLLAGVPDRRAVCDLIEHVAAAPEVHSGTFTIRPLHPVLDDLVIRIRPSDCMG